MASDLQKRSRRLMTQLQRDAGVLARWTGLLWILEIADAALFFGGLDKFGVHPRSISGLWGILFAPFLHGGFGHLLANTVPLVILGWLTMSRKRMDFYVTGAISALTAGLGAWLFGGAGTVHIGASGVVFGYFGFLLARGIYERSAKSIATSLLVGWAFGGMIWGVLPFLYAGVSWQSHLFGFIGGLLTARLLSKERRKRALPRR